MNPTIGRIVVYKLTTHDLDAIRAQGSNNPNNGALEAPAVVVRVFGENCVNLRVLVDGKESLWATSRLQGDGEGQWQWPSRV